MRAGQGSKKSGAGRQSLSAAPLIQTGAYN